jgi:hypothetical protein
MFVTGDHSRELGDRGKGRENDGASVMSHNVRCEGGGYKDVY